MKSSDIIALVSAAVAVLALFISIYTVSVTERVATSGFQSAERVKSDTAVLLSALRSIMIKAALYSQQDRTSRDDPKNPQRIDLVAEKTVVQSFLNSSTAVAYYALVIKRSKEAEAKGKKGEQWRTFFLMLGQLLQEDNVYRAGMTAAKIEEMFDTISDKDIEAMSQDLENLPVAVKGILQNRKYDTLFQAMISSAADHEIDNEKFERFIKFLRERGVKDPDVDLFWGVIADDETTVRTALGQGAKVDVTQGAIVGKYEDLWKKFEK